LRLPTSTEGSDGPTTQAPMLRRQGDPVDKSVNPSIPSDHARSRHQGNLTPKLEYGGEGIETDVRSDKRRMNRDGHTSQRIRNQLLNLPTRSTPPTGQTDNLRRPTCGQNGHLCHNDLETCKDGCKRTIRGVKGQLKQMESRTHLVQLKWTATRAAALTIAMQRPQWSHVTRLSRTVRNAAQRDSPRTATHSVIVTSGPQSHLIYYVFDSLLICWQKSKICPTTA